MQLELHQQPVLAESPHELREHAEVPATLHTMRRLERGAAHRDAPGSEHRVCVWLCEAREAAVRGIVQCEAARGVRAAAGDQSGLEALGAADRELGRHAAAVARLGEQRVDRERHAHL